MLPPTFVRRSDRALKGVVAAESCSRSHRLGNWAWYMICYCTLRVPFKFAEPLIHGSERHDDGLQRRTFRLFMHVA